mmetsp:Transcript_3287/g.4611  ORF Transcript_3287/g.4611 Transcript_3287/m.4611 type:complete len:121 (+) Transcript_3287:262-624(+)
MPNRTPTVFKGKTEEMQRYVFQLLTETSKKSQFKDTMEALELYAGKTYKQELKYLKPTFNDTSVELEVLELVELEGSDIIYSDDSKTIIQQRKLTHGEAIKYKQQIKLYLENASNLELAV